MQAKTGDKVKIHYTGKLDDGRTFECSKEREPLEVELGSGDILPGLETAISGMSVGETKTVDVAAEDAYGQPNPNAEHAVPRGDIPDDVILELGATLAVRTRDGRTLPVWVKDLTDTKVVIDANHPLAGEDLTFSIELVSIV